LIAVALRELAFLRRSSWDFAMVFLLPLIAIGMTLAIFWAGTPTRIPIAFVDEDATALARKIERAVEADPRFALALRTSSFPDALAAVRAGSCVAIVLVPHGSERTLLRGERARIVTYVNAMYLLSAAAVERDLQGVLTGASVAASVQRLGKEGAPLTAGIAESLPIALDLATLYNPRLDYMAYLAEPLVLAMLNLLVMTATVSALGRELRRGTAGEWLAAAGGSVGKAIAGKLLPYFAIFAAFESGTSIFFTLRAGWPSGLAVVLAATLATVAAYQGLSLAMVGLLGNMRMALSFASAYTSPAFAFAGVTFPQIGMPPFARWFSEAIPLTYFLHVQAGQLQLGQPAGYALRDLAILVFFACFGSAVGLVPMATLMRSPRSWFAT
jgi:ABC-2 type transport system permease protein